MPVLLFCLLCQQLYLSYVCDQNDFFKILFIYFLERGRVGEREGKKYQCVVASHAPPTGDLARNPGMCPDWELNQRPFGLQACIQSTEPHQPGDQNVFIKICSFIF